MDRHGKTLEVYAETLEEVRADITTEVREQNLYLLQWCQCRILTGSGNTHIGTLCGADSEGRTRELAKKTAAQAKHLLEEALVIVRGLGPTKDLPLSHILSHLSKANRSLKMFDSVRSTLEEALDLNIRLHGKENQEVAACQDQLALLCQQHSNVIRHVSITHVEFMETNLPLCYHSPGFPVLVAEPATVQWTRGYRDQKRGRENARPLELCAAQLQGNWVEM